MIRLRIVRGLYRAALEFPARAGDWLLRTTVDKHVCEWANRTGDDDA